MSNESVKPYITMNDYTMLLASRICINLFNFGRSMFLASNQVSFGAV